MSASAYSNAEGTLLFHWEPPRRRKLAIAGFLLGSAALHALCFYVFQVVYPPAISLLPPPATVSLIAPTSDEARAFLNRLRAEDPALASQTQRPADARAFLLPKVSHIPSYLIAPPRLKELPPSSSEVFNPSAMPPGPVPIPSPGVYTPPLKAKTSLIVSPPFDNRKMSNPVMKFHTALSDAPRSARFRIGVDSLGAVRYALIEQSSGDSALDAQARDVLLLTRFKTGSPGGQMVWATAAFDFGNDLERPAAATEETP